MINDLLLKTDDDIESLKKNEVIPFSKTEAIALIEDVKLTKYQYETIRSQIKQRNADILVPYNNFPLQKNSATLQKQHLVLRKRVSKLNYKPY